MGLRQWLCPLRQLRSASDLFRRPAAAHSALPRTAFLCRHRLIHWPPLYHAVHKLHHHNVNPGPWSGLAMHPVEHLLYFSGIIIHWIVPSNPLLAIYHILPRRVVARRQAISVSIRSSSARTPASTPHAYAHYLHHKLFRVQLCRRHRAARQMVRHLSRWIRCGPSRDKSAPRREPQRSVRIKQVEEAE